MLYVLTSGGYTKVGITRSENHLKRRLENLQTGNPIKLEIAAMFPKLGHREEVIVLERFNAFKCLGGREWLNMPPKRIVEFIAQLMEDTC